MTMTKPVRAPSTKLRIVSTSDVHLYHQRVPDSHIISCLDNIICEDGHGSGIDILIIAGDLFDRAIPWGDEALTPITACLIRIMRYCERHDIVLLILYGTPRHDRKQTSRMVDLMEQLEINIDFRYVDTLSIEYIAKFGINVLFVPDEWRTDVTLTLNEARELLRVNGLEKVDYAVMHGCFSYQLPPIESVQLKAHNVDAYLDMVRYMIFIGHHHLFSTYERAVAHGSLTRLAQGEEGPKGFVVYDLLDDDSYKLTFVENKDAWTFKSINACNMTFNELVSVIEDMELRKGSYLDIVAGADDECSRLFKRLTKEIHGINLELKRPKTKKSTVQLEQDLVHVAPVSINAHNVADVIVDWLVKSQFSQDLIQRCEEAIKHEQLIANQQS